MLEKPKIAAGYLPDQVARMKSTCLYVATKLGDLMNELVVVEGLVPSLLIDQAHLPDHVLPHRRFCPRPSRCMRRIKRRAQPACFSLQFIAVIA